MKRAGGWLLGLLVVGAMGGGGWFALRRILHREDVWVTLVAADDGGGPTSKALFRGAQFALQEMDGRVGKYRITLDVIEPREVYVTPVRVVAWFGTSEALLARGHQQSRPFHVSVVDTHPAEPDTCYRISPGSEQLGTNAALWAKKTGARRVVLIHDPESLRSKTIGTAFDSSARALGLTVEAPAEATINNVDRILASKPDLVFYSGEEAPYGTTAKVFAALRAKGFTGSMVTAEADPEVSFLATRPTLVEGTYLVSPFAPAPPDLAARMGFAPGPHVTAGYFAMKAVLETIDRANSVEEEDLHRAAMALPSLRRPCALYVARNGVFEFVETFP